MKTLFTLLLVTAFSSAFAYDEGRISITVAAKNVQVSVDGRIYQDNDNTIVLNSVQPGNHTIRIYKIARNNGNGRNNKRADNRNELVYSSNIYVRPSHHVDVMVNRFGKALVDDRALNDRNGSWDDDDWNDGYNGGYNGNNGGYNNGYQAMNEYEFNQSLQRIRNQWIGKLGSARDLVNTNYLSTLQVRQVLQIFSSENDKLELAKVSYKNIVDRQNFRQLYDLFSYQSQAELDRYVRDTRF